MRGLFVATVGLVVVGLTASGGAQTAPPRTTAQPKPAPVASHAPTTTDAQPSLVTQYCVGCHNDKAKTGGLTLASFDPPHPEPNADTADMMTRNLRLGMMQPPLASLRDTD